MATKKGKKKATKKARTAAKKRSSAPRPKGPTPRRPKRAKPRATAAGHPSARMPVARKPAARKPAAPKPVARKPPAPKPAAGKSAVMRSVARKPAPTNARRAGASRVGESALEPVRRQVGPGRFDPRYKAALLERSSKPEIEPRAFIDSPRSPRDDLAEELGEEVIERATTGEDDPEETRDAVVPEEQGGPFVETSGAQEFADDIDPSNPRGAKREPFPTT